MKIKMTSIPVNDPVKAFKYYTEILGFEKFMYNPKEQVAIVVSAEDSNGTALLLEPNELPEYKNFQKAIYAKGIPALTLAVSNLKEEYIRLVNLDVRFIQKPTEMDWGWEAIFDDSNGNYVQLVQDKA